MKTKPVRYALLQQTLEPPQPEQLRRAFMVVRCLVDGDAHGIANDAFGILVRDLEESDAGRLQGALRVEGVETELVPMECLPKVPSTRYVQRIGLGADTLLIYDPIGRPVPVEWRHLMLIAAGTVRDELTLELILANGVARFSLVVAGAAPNIFRCLEAGQERDPVMNLGMLVAELAKAAPGAMLNRGAWALRQETPSLFSYPSRNAFFEEITWMLHRALKAKES